MEDWLASGVQAVITNDRPRARDCFMLAVRENPHSEQAWLWLARCLEDSARRQDCYQHVLRLNPINEEAYRYLFRAPAAAGGLTATDLAEAPAAADPPAPDAPPAAHTLPGSEPGPDTGPARLPLRRRLRQKPGCLGCLAVLLGGALLGPLLCLGSLAGLSALRIILERLLG